MFFESKEDEKEYFELLKILSENSLIAEIDSTVSLTGHGLNFIESPEGYTGGIKLKVKDQYGRELYTDGFLAGQTVIHWALSKIRNYVAENLIEKK